MNQLTYFNNLLKSKKYVEEIQKDMAEATIKNWKTSLAGIILAVVGLVNIWGDASMKAKVDDSYKVLMGAGLLVASDGKKS